jgi:hypothetical protein
VRRDERVVGDVNKNCQEIFQKKFGPKTRAIDRMDRQVIVAQPFPVAASSRLGAIFAVV